jgi:carboxypeptidase Q
MVRCPVVVLAFAAVVLPSIKFAQNPAGGPSGQDRAYWTAMEDADRKIFAEVKAHSELMKNLEYLTGKIGPRMTGSAQMQKASEWTLQRFHDYGLDAHLETTQVSHAWYRGVETAEILSPIQRAIPIHSYGWSMATKGAIAGPVVFLDEETLEEVQKNQGRLKGAIVCLTKPSAVPPAGLPAENAFDATTPPGPPPPPGQKPHPPLSYADHYRLNEMVAKAGALAILADSNKPDRLFNMSRGSPCCDSTALPMTLITHEDYDLIYRWSRHGPVQMKINLQASFSPGPEPASITVAEIKGSEHPEERVIIGGHLDSWDLGEGALDNGTGAMATLEAARALKTLGWQPKRTITFILFTGEEWGGVGSKLFLKNHAAEIPKMAAALVLDTGTGRVNSIALENLWETGPMMFNIYQPLKTVFDLKPLEARFYDGSDHISFIRAGVPGFLCVQAPAQYREVHHSQADTFDKAVPEEINQGAAVLASWAWNTSEYRDVMPHHSSIPHETSLGTPTP